MSDLEAMLQNTGPYGPNETPISISGAVNMSQMSTNGNFTQNLSNMGKTAHQTPEQPSPQYHLPDYSLYNHSSLNLSQQISTFPNYQPPSSHSAYMAPNSTSYHDTSWQNGFFPMNLNAQPPHGYNMLNYPSGFDKNVPTSTLSNSFLDQHFHGKSLPINIPQVPTKAFQKYHSDDYEMFNMEKEKYNLHQRNLVEDTSEFMQDKIPERPLLDNTKRRSLENTVRLIEDILINTTRNKELEQQKEMLSHEKDDTREEKGILQQQKNIALHQRNVPQKETVIQNAKQSKTTYHNIRKEANSNETITSDISTSDENCEPKEETDINDQNDSNDKSDEQQEISSENVTDDKDSQQSDLDETDEELSDKNKDNDPLEGTDNINIKTESSSPEPVVEETETIDIKPMLDSVFVKLDIEGEACVDVKVENFYWTDTDYTNPFHRDINGIQRDDLPNENIIDSSVSVNEAMVAIKEGMLFFFLAN